MGAVRQTSCQTPVPVRVIAGGRQVTAMQVKGKADANATATLLRELSGRQNTLQELLAKEQPS